MEGGSQKGELCCFWNSQENGKRETAQVEHFQLFLGHRLTYISMTVRFHCQISDCDTLSVLVTDILVGQCKQHTWTWIGWWLLRSSQYYGVWKEFIKGRCYETEALCIINSIWLEFRKLFKLVSGSGPRFRLALYEGINKPWHGAADSLWKHCMKFIDSIIYCPKNQRNL